MFKAAMFSEDNLFRYTLERSWDADRPLLLVVMLNPSTADHEKDDPTITRLIHRAKEEGFGGFVVCNLFAFRATKPVELEYRWAKLIAIDGFANQEMMEICAKKCSTALVAWGCHPLVKKRERKVLDLLYQHCSRVLMIDKTKDGFPKHPLHVAYSVRFQTYSGRFAR